MGREDEAGREFRLALDDNPYWAPAHYNYGVYLVQLGEKQEAAAHFRKAVALTSSYAAAHHALAILLHEEGKTGEAISHLQAVLRFAADPARRIPWQRSSRREKKGTFRVPPGRR